MFNQQQELFPLEPVPQDLFLSFDSLKEAIHYSQAQLPITDSQELYRLLMAYHNTLIKNIKQ